ncbi:hypothetical protein EOPP23_18645 [Endozoicomonas sp. OPT23]|uniref:hypothetical protein n=1 Tax=Endozoicomonas sp. OPT23 TaxID=2072845 RepID=UPI001891D6ED|nr:hypothetical protein [Endozoicomonas sp. OPT23]MRI34998.1 hypothetical protein [Endozoicomonas sp. OPT23]
MHKLRSVFTWKRRAIVLVDPRVKLKESRDTGYSPYSHLPGRQLNLRSKQQVFNYPKFAGALSNLGIRTSLEDGTPRPREETLNEFQGLLSEQAKSAHAKAFKHGSTEELVALTRLRNLILSNNWPEALSTLSSVVQPLCPQFAPFIEALEQFQISTPAKYIPEKAEDSWRVASKHIELMAGDITKINQGQTPITDTIVCPVLSSRKRTTGIQDRLTEHNPMISDKSFMKSVRKMHPGQSEIKETRSLGRLGFNHIIFSCLPDQDSANLDQQLISTYEQAISVAHQQKKASVAIPILSIGLVSSSQRSAVIAVLAVKRYLQKCTWDNPPPKIHLICPATEEGYEIQTILKQHLQP